MLLNVSNVTVSEEIKMDNAIWVVDLFDMHRRNQRVIMIHEADGSFDPPDNEESDHGC